MNKEYIFVDLDGTFIKTDMLVESFLNVFKSNPFILFSCLVWLMQGKAKLKHELALRSQLKVENLPLNTELYKYLEEEKSAGKEIWLATASNENIAKDIVANFDIFTHYLASDENTNLKGKNKALKISQMDDSFTYCGNDIEDFDVFQQASTSILVNPTKKAQKASQKNSVSRVLDMPQFRFSSWLKQLRVHQWLKNILIFVPLIVAGQYFNIASILSSGLAFLSFSLLASSTYIINDLLDLQSDRAHSRKKFRPIACGDISILSAIGVALLLFVVSLFLAVLTSPLFLFTLLTYLALTLSYSFLFKQFIVLDVVMLACLYTIRIIAGAYAISVPISFWLLAFSSFLFLSLALVKRCSELNSLIKENKLEVSGRDYRVADYNILQSFGASSAMLAILMFCFYINNNVLTQQYQEPQTLWLIMPILSYWLMRMWVKTSRGEMHDDPIVFTLKDKTSLVAVFVCIAIAVVAQLFKF